MGRLDNEEDGPATCHLCGALLVGGQTRCRMCGSVYKAKGGKAAKIAAGATGGAPKAAWVGLSLERTFYWMLSALVVGTVMAIAFYVIPTPVYSDPGVRLIQVLGILFVGSALLVMLDVRRAKRLTAGEPEAAGSSPVNWFVSVLVGWFMAMPTYVRGRELAMGDTDGKVSKYKLAVAGSVAVGMMVLVSLGTMVYRNQTYKSEQQRLDTLLKIQNEKFRKATQGVAK